METVLPGMFDSWFDFIQKNGLNASVYHLIFELVLIICVIWLLRKKRLAPQGLTTEEEEQIINAWNPRPLVDLDKDDFPDYSEYGQIWDTPSGRPGKYLEINGEKYLNMATHNYLGLVDSKKLDEAAEKCIRQYGVGSCGPRGFYGTVDVHLQLEEQIAKFVGFEETALYSYGFATVSSAIPSYAKAGDIIFADELVCFPIQKGLQASRSTIVYFKHNDWEDLEEKLQELAEKDKKNPTLAKATRRFCVVEGIYVKTGDMCPLKEVAALCRKHKVRLFVDETISFGTIGRGGRGITEHLGVSLDDIDFIGGSLEHGLASFGGFIVGSSFVVDHQRISGLGYCFSASLPPLLAGAGIQALKMIEEDPGMVLELQDKCKFMQKLIENDLSVMYHTCNELSPVKFLYLMHSQLLPRLTVRGLLDEIIIFVRDNYKIALIQPHFLNREHMSPVPSIRLCVNRLHTFKEIECAIYAIEEACQTLKMLDRLTELMPDEETKEKMIQYKIDLAAYEIKQDKEEKKAEGEKSQPETSEGAGEKSQPGNSKAAVDKSELEEPEADFD